MGKYYAVKIGRTPGIYESWDECQIQTNKYPGAVFKKFDTKQEAETFLGKQTKPFRQKKSTYTHQKFTTDQQQAYDIMMQGKNVFLTGEAGTRKSYVIQAFIKQNEKSKKKMIVCAPTGIAAIQIGGVTIHRVFQVSPEPQINTSKVQVPKTVKEADIIIIDEISMCRVDLFDYALSVIRKAESMSKPKQLIVVGDFFQLPPVTTNHDYDILTKIYPNYHKGFAFESKYWNDCHFKTIVLNEVIRQLDQTFIENLNKIRIGDNTAIEYFNNHASKEKIHNGIVLSARNALVNKINKEELDKIDTEPITYYSQTIGDVKSSDKTTVDELELKVNARVMIIVNDIEDFLYQNGSMGTIVKLSENSVQVKLDQTSKIVTINPYEWDIENYEITEDIIDGVSNKRLKKVIVGKFIQLPLKLAYAITIHKSQGQTYDAINLVPYCFDCGQLYVALSRVKSIEGLALSQPIKNNYLMCDEKVKAFYDIESYNGDALYIQFAKEVLELSKNVDYPPQLLQLIDELKTKLY